MYVLTPPQPEREMISLRLRLFAFELFIAAKLSSSSGTDEFHPRIFLELHSPFPLRYHKVVIKSIKNRVYKQINLLQIT